MRMNTFKYTVLFVVYFINVGAIMAQQNSLNLKIAKMETQWTSGGGALAVKGKLKVDFFAPSGIAATLQYKDVNSNTWADAGVFLKNNGSGTEVHSVEIPDLFVRTVIYCVRITANNNAGVASTSKVYCSIPFNFDPNLNRDGKPEMHIASYQPAFDGSFSPFIDIKCFSALGCANDFETFTTKSQDIAPYFVRKPVSSLIRCGEKKIFQITIKIDGVEIISDTIHYVGFTKDKPATLLQNAAYATIENDKVHLFWKNSETRSTNDYTIEKYFVLERRTDAGNYQIVDTDNKLVRNIIDKRNRWDYLDETTLPTEHNYTYKLSYFDYCENQSDPIFISPIHLTQNKEYDLLWNPDNNNLVVEYYIEYYDIKNDNPRKEFTFARDINLVNPPEIANFYRIRANLKNYDGETDKIIYSNFLENAEKLKVLNPTVFTPDRQGPSESDTFKVIVRGQYTFMMNIYDRYGLLMYTSDNYDLHRQEGWDGKIMTSGIDAPEGVYVFEVRVTNKNRNSLTKNGSFVLIRN
jgi:gliding motility-associated-like protein